MKQDEFIEMAVQAGFTERNVSLTGNTVFVSSPSNLEAFAKLVAAKEREACAKFFDDNDTLMFWGSQAATYIRARGEAV